LALARRWPGRRALPGIVTKSVDLQMWLACMHGE
jgi:hypothetical protein